MDSSVIAPITPVYFVIRVKLEHVPRYDLQILMGT